MSDKVTAALLLAMDATSTPWKDETVRYVLAKLQRDIDRDEQAVLDAIDKAARECEFKLKLAAILDRIVRPVRSTYIEHKHQRTLPPPEFTEMLERDREAHRRSVEAHHSVCGDTEASTGVSLATVEAELKTHYANTTGGTP